MNEETRKQIDVHLEAIAGMYAHLGKDSIKTERLTAKILINREMEAIKLLDIEFYKQCNPDGRDKS